jgi:hypothetical protein
MWAPLARHAKRAGISGVLFMFIAIQTALLVPIGYTLFKTEPWDMYARLYGETDFEVSMVFTEGTLSFNGEHLQMAMPLDIVPDWVIQERDMKEMFNYLFLYNRYFTDLLLPVMLFIAAGFFITQILFYVCVSWMFGQTRLMTTYMTMKERLVICVYASLIAMFPGMLVGFIMPVLHILIFEVIVIYVAYKVSQEY